MRKMFTMIILMAAAACYAFSANVSFPSNSCINEDSRCVEYKDDKVSFSMDPLAKTVKVRSRGEKIGSDAVLAFRYNSDIIVYSSLSGPDNNGWYTYQGDYDEFVALISQGIFFIQGSWMNRAEVEYSITSSGKQISDSIAFNYYENECELFRRLEVLGYKDVYGEKGPAGGYIILDKGSYSEGWRYIEVAPYDVRFYNGRYSCDGTDPLYRMAPEVIPYAKGYSGMRFSEKLGDAKRLTYNTDIEQARVCMELEYNGYSDWLLPTTEEKWLIVNNLFNRGKGNCSDEFKNSAYRFVDSLVTRPIRYY